MKIPKETANKMITGSVKELWDTFINLEGEYNSYIEDYDAVKYGIKINFPIYWMWKDTGKIVLKPKDNKIFIDGEKFDEDKYETEKEERRKIMVEAILNNTEEADVLTPR